MRRWRLDLKTGKAVRLPGLSLPGRNMGGLSLHPDGWRIAFTAGHIYSEGVYGGAEVRDEVRVLDKIAAWLGNSAGWPDR